VTVKRLLPNGSIVEFTAQELWIENYATKSSKVYDPNSMWKKRPYAQLAKCSEAQALRKAFPELGAAPTADEMEGKALDDGNTIEGSATIVKESKPDPVEMTDEGLMKICADKVDGEGVITKMGAKSRIQSGDKTAKELIDFLSAKYTMPQAIIDKINLWTPKGEQQ
jgi:hypothetical protein